MFSYIFGKNNKTFRIWSIQLLLFHWSLCRSVLGFPLCPTHVLCESVLRCILNVFRSPMPFFFWKWFHLKAAYLKTVLIVVTTLLTMLFLFTVILLFICLFFAHCYSLDCSHPSSHPIATIATDGAAGANAPGNTSLVNGRLRRPPLSLSHRSILLLLSLVSLPFTSFPVLAVSTALLLHVTWDLWTSLFVLLFYPPFFCQELQLMVPGRKI